MALGSSLTGISFAGISSGIDTESIISRLLQIDQMPIQRMQVQQAQLTSRLGLMSSLRAKVGAFGTSMAALSSLSAFKSLSATVGDSSLAEVALTGTAGAGRYDLNVLQLAQAHKIASNGQTSTTGALGYDGVFILNGKSFTVSATDSLKSIAEKINAGKVGVTASIINGGTGNAYLSLTSQTTGQAAAIQLGDIQGSVLADLGLTDTDSVLGPSFTLASKSTAIGGVLGLTSAPAGIITLNGTDIAIDLNSDSLEDIAAAINASGSGASAEVKNHGSGFRLEISGLSTQDDPDGILRTLGVLRSSTLNEVVAAQDAQFEIDGIALAHGDNAVENVIAGATLNLKKVGTTAVEISQDLEAVETKIQDFVDRYNDLIAFVRSNTSLNTESFETGALFGDSTVGRIEEALGRTLFGAIQGNEGRFHSLADIGITLDADGKMKVDGDRLSSVLDSDLDGVSAIFRSTGATSVRELEFIGGTSKTKPSGPAGYQVFITALAQKQITEAAQAQGGALAQDEVFTFSGAAFGGGSYEITLEAGLTQEQVIERLNEDPRLKNLVSASSDGGKLRIESKNVGTANAFSLVSNVAAGGGGTGWGAAGVSLQLAADIAGTINGEAAVGAGQVLTGAIGNANTEGLQFRYTGVAMGVVGTVSYSPGVAGFVGSAITSITDSVNGLLSQNDKAIQDQIDGLAKSIAFRQDQVEAKRQLLQSRFSRMEQMIAELQAQQARIASFGQ